MRPPGGIIMKLLGGSVGWVSDHGTLAEFPIHE